MVNSGRPGEDVAQRAGDRKAGDPGDVRAAERGGRGPLERWRVHEGQMRDSAVEVNSPLREGVFEAD